MKNFLFFLLPFLPFAGQGQTLDSAAVAQQRVDSMLAQCRLFFAEGKYQEALLVAAAARQASFENFGNQHDAYLRSLDHYGLGQAHLGNAAAADSAYLEAKLTREMLGQTETTAYADNLTRLGTLRKDNGSLDESEVLYQTAIAVHERLEGRETEAVAGILTNLGQLYRKKTDYPAAEKSLLEAKAIWGKLDTLDHPQFVNLLLSLGILYDEMGQLETAERMFEEAKSIHQSTGQANGHTYSIILENFGRLYKKMKRPGKAEPLLQEVLEIRAKTFGTSHPNYAKACYNLAALYLEMGQYSRAEGYFLQARDLFAVNPGRENQEYIGCVSNIANLYKRLGSFEQSEAYNLEVMELSAAVLGKESTNYSVVLNNLGALYIDWGKYEKAEPLLLESQVLRAKLFGTGSTRYAQTIGNLALLYHKTGQLDLAEKYAVEIADIFASTVGKDHFYYAMALDVQGGIFQSENDRENAAACFLAAQKIKVETIGPDHPSYLVALANLANFHFHFDEPDSAGYYFRLASDLRLADLNRNAGFLSEQELQLSFEKSKTYLDDLLSFNHRYDGGDGGAPVVFENLLFYKGYFLDHLRQLSAGIANAGASARNKFAEWQFVKQQLAAEYASPISKRGDLQTLLDAANKLEKELAREMAEVVLSSENITWQQVQAQLAPTEAAIEFIHFNYKNPNPTDSTLYAALVLRSGWEAPRWVTLFEEKQLAPLLAGHDQRRADYVSQLFENQNGTSLDELIWEPLAPHLDGVERIYFSPSGILHRIPLAAIEIGENETLGDRFALHQLGSTRQLVATAPNATATATATAPATVTATATIFGGVKYDMDSTAIASANDLLALRSTGSDDVFSETTRTLTRGGKSWKYLPWTEVEAKTLDAIFKNEGISSQLHLGFEATEEIFRNIGSGGVSPTVLHIATHGYFFPDPASVGSQQSAGGSQDVVFRASEHPMIRSGLILAGANHAWTGGQPLENLEDGILTAYEVSQMDLRETELVVLSACETGLGDIEGNEGVYGLQRAFKIAGARYVLMSLWQVPDFVTQELMTAFYTNWLTENMPIPDAFRKAQQQVKADRPEPFYWAGFVLVE